MCCFFSKLNFSRSKNMHAYFCSCRSSVYLSGRGGVGHAPRPVHKNDFKIVPTAAVFMEYIYV
jgi:hypothetical protein